MALSFSFAALTVSSSTSISQHPFLVLVLGLGSTVGITPRDDDGETRSTKVGFASGRTASARCKIEYVSFQYRPLIHSQEFLRFLVIASSLQWPTTISFASSLQLGFLATDMHFGSHLRGIFMTSWGLATSATLAKADSTDSSISCCPQMTHRIKTLAFQTITNRSSPMYQNISYSAYFVSTTFVRLESPWSPMNMGNLPQGCEMHNSGVVSFIFFQAKRSRGVLVFMQGKTRCTIMPSDTSQAGGYRSTRWFCQVDDRAYRPLVRLDPAKRIEGRPGGRYHSRHRD